PLGDPVVRAGTGHVLIVPAHQRQAACVIVAMHPALAQPLSPAHTPVTCLTSGSMRLAALTASMASLSSPLLSSETNVPSSLRCTPGMRRVTAYFICASLGWPPRHLLLRPVRLAVPWPPTVRA